MRKQITKPAINIGSLPLGHYLSNYLRTNRAKPAIITTLFTHDENSIPLSMIKVAVAGGSGSIGGAIAQALEKSASYELIILSREHNADPKVVTVDFTDIDNLRGVLEQHEVHTVISAVSLQTEDSGRSQMNLIEAADQSLCTRRFMPSEFGAHYKTE